MKGKLSRKLISVPWALWFVLLPEVAWGMEPCPPGFRRSLWSELPAAAIALLGIAGVITLLRRGRPVLAFVVAVLATAATFVALIVAGFTGSCVPA